jgi:5-dehydro-2-deoxygluconokinase
VLLGRNAPIQNLAESFRDARASSTCRGFALGRTIFHAPSRAWLAREIDDGTLVQRVRANFELLIAAWRDSRNVPVQERVA